MKEIISKIKSNKIIFILVLSFLLNIGGLFYAYPILHLVWDETTVMGATLKMINNYSLRPAFAEFYHFALGVYIYLPFYLIFFLILFILGIVHSIDELRRMVILDFDSFKMLLPIARFISVIAGCWSVYLVYRISNLLFKERKRISLSAAFLTATSLMLVQLSHFGRIWIIQIWAILLGFYYLVWLLVKKKDKLINYLLAAFLTAVAFGLHGVGIILYFPFLFVHYHLNRGKKLFNIFIKNKKFWLANLVILALIGLFFFLNPYGYYNYYSDGFVKAITGELNRAKADPNYNSLTYSISFLLEYEPLLIILFLISLPILFFKQRRNLYLLFCFIVPYYIFLVPILKIDQARYIAPIIPFLGIIAAYGFVQIIERLSSRFFKYALIILFSLLFLLMPVYWNISLFKPNTYVLTKEWIENNLTSGQSIINFDSHLVLNENKRTIEVIEEYMIGSMNARRRYLLTRDEKSYLQPNYFILYQPNSALLARLPDNFLSQNKFDYLVISWWHNQEFKQMRQNMLNLDYQLELVQKFYPNQDNLDLTDLVNNMRRPFWLLRNIRYTGPYIEIYKID